MGLKIGCIILFTGTWSNDWKGEGGGEGMLLNPLTREMKP